MEFPQGRLNLYVTEIGEPHNNSLRIVIAEAVLGDPRRIAFGDIDLGEGRPIVVANESRFFELTWGGYVAYAVRDESYWAAEPNEPPFEGHLTQRFESSFLRFLAETTFADSDYPGPLQHWALTTLNHCIDVVSVESPQITLLPESYAGQRIAKGFGVG